ncbi:vitamin B6 photo-protection and homoeostasis-domain-containing protein [Podospora conica]|nr:vitamin B6 photo-protection and homoeostasis-domain-containing protein [Schizothecium conicum]
MSTKIYDIDPAGNVLCTYTNSEKEAFRSQKTSVPLPRRLLYAFLPAGYPHSVTPDYLAYQTYDSLQAFASTITSLLATRASLTALGVGDPLSTPTAALLVQIASSTVSRLATILFAHRLGTAVQPEAKRYRFLADVLNDGATLLDLLTPALPSYGVKMSVVVGAGVLRALCGVAAGASKASLSVHFARGDNLAEMSAKEAAQETVVSLVGLVVGSGVVRVVTGAGAVWGVVVVLVGVHLGMNYAAVKAVELRTLNRQRATIVFTAWLRGEGVLGPGEVARRERVLGGGGGRLRSRGGGFTGSCGFARGYGEVKGVGEAGGYVRYELETEGYFLGVWHRGRYFYMRLAMKEGGGEGGPLAAWFDAVNHAWHFEEALKGGWQSHYENAVPVGYVEEEKRRGLFEALRGKGWDLETNALETRLPVRVRVGEGRKGL